MGLLNKIFRNKVKNDAENKQKNTKYLFGELEKYVGDVIEVYYINQNIAKIEIAILKFSPCKDFFYIRDKVGHYIIYWDSTDNYGKRKL